MSNEQEWQQLANKELSRREKTVDSLVQQTAEGIAIKPLYTEADLDNLEVTGTLPGLPNQRVDSFLPTAQFLVGKLLPLLLVRHYLLRKTQSK